MTNTPNTDYVLQRSVCQRCNRAISHGGTKALSQAPQWWDDDDGFMCPDGEEEHMPTW
jgi:hypothetical protein